MSWFFLGTKNWLLCRALRYQPENIVYAAAACRHSLVAVCRSIRFDPDGLIHQRRFLNLVLENKIDGVSSCSLHRIDLHSRQNTLLYPSPAASGDPNALFSVDRFNMAAASKKLKPMRREVSRACTAPGCRRAGRRSSTPTRPAAIPASSPCPTSKVDGASPSSSPLPAPATKTTSASTSWRSC